MGLETVAIMAIASTVLATGSAIYSGVQQSKAADKQAELQDQQAAMEKAAGEAEAAKIREKGVRLQATQNVALAGSGVKLDGQGSGGALLSETTRLAESDALAAITGGKNRATLLQGEAAISRDKGNAALISGGLNATSTLLGGYNSYQKAKQPGDSAAKINLDIGSKYAASSKPKLTLLGG